MGVFCDYFSAAADEDAAAVHAWPAGPTCPPDNVGAKDTVELKGIDPVVMMGTLEALLTGLPYDQLVDRPRHGAVLRDNEDGGGGILTITDEFTAALAAATDERIRTVAEPWSQTEEFWGRGDPAELAELLQDLRDLAVRTIRDGHRLYCWWSL
ncbi:hypothetical protein N5079_11400 [Planotetraspora sp. A-T 1434]|uniref:hypothetical protein n=1 Tax=Planotetraspora sp. A-T 1434 TaxID=2979219 RepID=UPI0021C0E75C|nr:hypothetical protein [Planotetraspora sp. A-T 1434]MCT9930824.1 hypothetical protein [Planotetraspora sp. A-T 1434]